MVVIQLCGSLGKKCGIARYSSYVAEALTNAGLENYLLGNCEDLKKLVAQEKFKGVEKTVLVQHEYGIYDFLSELSSRDTTSTIISELNSLVENGSINNAAFIMHTLVVKDHVLNFANKQIFSSRFPVFHLNKMGAAYSNAEFLEHGIHLIRGSNLDDLITNKTSIKDFGNKQLKKRSIGSFGLLSPNKLPTRMFNLAAAYNLKFIGNFATRSQEAKNHLEDYLAKNNIEAKIGYDFVSEQELSDMMSNLSFVCSFQEDFEHFATTGSARFLLNACVPLIVNSSMPFMDLKEAAVYVDGVGSEEMGLLIRNEDFYFSAIEKVYKFGMHNTLDVVYIRLLGNIQKIFDEKEKSDNRHYYFHDNLISQPNIKDAFRFLADNSDKPEIEKISQHSSLSFCEVTPATIFGKYVNSALTSLDKNFSMTFEKVNAVNLHDGLIPRSNYLSNQKRLHGQPINLAMMLILPSTQWEEYLSRKLPMVGDEILSLISKIQHDSIFGEKIKAVAKAFWLNDVHCDLYTRPGVEEFLVTSSLFCFELDLLPINERAYCAALLLDRRQPDTKRFSFLRKMFRNGITIQDLSATSEFYNVRANLLDRGDSTFFAIAEINKNKDVRDFFESHISSSPWKKYIEKKYNLSEDGQTESYDETLLYAEKRYTGGNDTNSLIEKQPLKFPTIALEPYARFGKDLPWLDVAKILLTQPHARIFTSASEFESSYSKAKFIDTSIEIFPSEFDLFVVHKNSIQNFTKALNAYPERPIVAFANEVFYILSFTRFWGEGYVGVHSSEFPPAIKLDDLTI